MAVDGIDALGLAASAAILVYASSGRAASSGQRDGKPLLMVGCGGLLISAVRLGAKIILKAEGPSRRSTSFPTISILRHFWRERLRRDPYPHSASPPAILKWREIEQANIHEHEERNHVYEDELRQRLYEITLQNQLTELVAAKRGVLPEEVLVSSSSVVDLLMTAYCLSPEQPKPGAAIMVRADLEDFGLYKSLARAKQIEIIELPGGDFDRTLFYELICDRIALIFLSCPSHSGSPPVSPELIRAIALHAPDALVVVDERSLNGHDYTSACSIIKEVMNVIVLSSSEFGGPRSQLTPFSEVLIGKENVILTVKEVIMNARSRRSSSHVDIIITTKNHISPSAETLMKFDSETGLMHRKVIGHTTPPRHHKSSSMQGLEALHHSLQHRQEKRASMAATAAGLMNKYL